MKRKYADRSKWSRILKKKFWLTDLAMDEFRGRVSLYQMEVVKEALWVTYPGTRCCIADDGYAWLQHLPEQSHFAVTTMFDAEGQVVQWYIDICRNQGVDGKGIPWFDDLYLDIVILPSGDVHLLDADELEEAFEQGDISPDEYDLAWREARRLLQEIEAGTFPFFDLSVAHRTGLPFRRVE